MMYNACIYKERSILPYQEQQYSCQEGGVKNVISFIVRPHWIRILQTVCQLLLYHRTRWAAVLRLIMS